MKDRETDKQIDRQIPADIKGQSEIALHSQDPLTKANARRIPQRAILGQGNDPKRSPEVHLLRANPITNQGHVISPEGKGIV